jgi:hypothetical protein
MVGQQKVPLLPERARSECARSTAAAGTLYWPHSKMDARSYGRPVTLNFEMFLTPLFLVSPPKAEQSHGSSISFGSTFSAQFLDGLRCGFS